MNLEAFLATERATREAAAAADRWLEPYREAARDAVSQPDLDDVLREALGAIAFALDADAVALLLANADGSELIARAATGLGRDVELGLGIPAGSGVSGIVLASSEPLIIGDLATVDIASETLRASGAKSFVGVPIVAGKRCVGVFHATSRTPEKFGNADAELLSLFAGPIASAIERVDLFEAERAARRSAERASVRAERIAERLRGLQRITASLASASTVEEICQVIIDEAAPGVSGAERAIWMLRDSHLLLVAGEGLSAEYPEIPLDPTLPAAENLRDGRPLFVETREELSQRWPRLADGPTSSFAGLPLIVGGRRLGLMAVGLRDEHVFEVDERSYLATVAEQAAEALLRAEDRAALEAALATGEERREQLDFLAHASERLAASLDLEIISRIVAELGVPRVADRCALYLVEDSRITKQVLAPELNEDESLLFESHDPTLDAERGVGAVIRTGRPEYFPRIEDAMLVAGARSGEELELLRRVGLGGLLLLPLKARGRNLGALAFVNRADRDIPPKDRALAGELAARAAVAIDNAMLYRREAEVARRLAASLIPERLPLIEGLDLGVRYETGSTSSDVGGDFYDVWPVAPDEWLVMVGDVQGKGIGAAALTSFVRYTVKSAAVSETSPAALLQHLNSAMIRNIVDTARDPEHPWDHARLCTVVLVRLERSNGAWLATASSAGHPLPLRRSPDGSIDAPGWPGLLLGVEEGATYREWGTEMLPGSLLVCFTDGVADRPGYGPHAPLEEVVGRVTGSAREIADTVCDAALARQAPADDLVVLVIGVDQLF